MAVPTFVAPIRQVDSLDSLWLMGLRAEFRDATEWIRSNLAARLQRVGGSTSVFETTIRTLGGLLAAYDLSKV
jgi:mannosyl-oligosaccharide alpha-1,2-mannosidase